MLCTKNILYNFVKKKFVHTIYLSLGSNLNNRQENIFKAKVLIKKNIGIITKESSIYLSEPWGYSSSNNFLNQCIAINTHLEPLELLRGLKKIETILGRKKQPNNIYIDRTIDIDILFYDNIYYKYLDILTIPHPLLHTRRFVLLPLVEIAPNFFHPLLNQSISELLNKCKDKTLILNLDHINS